MWTAMVDWSAMFWVSYRDVPREWAEPLGDLLETYLKGKEKLSIRELAKRTARLARM